MVFLLPVFLLVVAVLGLVGVPILLREVLLLVGPLWGILHLLQVLLLQGILRLLGILLLETLLLVCRLVGGKWVVTLGALLVCHWVDRVYRVLGLILKPLHHPPCWLYVPPYVQYVGQCCP